MLKFVFFKKKSKIFDSNQKVVKICTVENKTCDENFWRKVHIKCLYILSILNHHIGIRHIIYLALLVVYTLLGGLIFNAIEHEPSQKMLVKTISEIQANIANLSYQLAILTDADNISTIVEENYQQLLSIEGLNTNSAFHKLHDKILHENWDFLSAMFYSMAIYTTIGYGTISCHTALGKIMTIIYASIGIPLMLLVLADVGVILLAWFTMLYNFSIRIYRKITKSMLTDAKIFPTSFCILILWVYLLLCAVLITFFDYKSGHMPGLSFGDSLYFCFKYSPLISTLFLFGLSLVSMVTNTAYDQMRIIIFGFIDVWDGKLENLYENVHKNHNNNLNAITNNTSTKFPPDYNGSDDSNGKRSLSVQVNLDLDTGPSPLMRAPFSTPAIKLYRRSCSSEGRTLRPRPTLGILATNDGVKKSTENINM